MVTNYDEMDDIEDGFDQLLDRIRAKEHPQYGSLSWDGESREVTVTVQFENGRQEDPEAVRARALRYLASLTPEERQSLQVDVQMRDGTPVRAVLKGRTNALSPERLRALSEAK
jgi:hypothetical protein